MINIFKKKTAGAPWDLSERISVATLEQISVGALYWHLASGTEAATPRLLQTLPPSADQKTPPYTRLLQLFDSSHKHALDEAVRELRKSGKPFALAVRTLDKKTFQVSGYRMAGAGGGITAPLADVLCLIDQTDLRQQLADFEERSLQTEKGHELMQMMINSVPVPIWVRRQDLSLALVNDAYRRAVRAEDNKPLPEIAQGLAGAEGRELAHKIVASKSPATVKGHLVLWGQRRYVEVIEAPLSRAREEFLSVGYIRDLNEQFEMESQLQRLEKGHEQVLQTIAIAIAIYGADRRMTFHNAAFAEMFQLDEKFLNAKPMLSEVLDKLREKRLLPEVANFPKFKEDQNQLFQSLIEPREELMHLPSGQAFRTHISPHPQGGLVFVYEDVSENLELTSSVNTLIQVQRETLDNLYEGVVVFGSDGRLRLSNPAYQTLWAMPQGEHPHLSDILENNRHLFPHDHQDWATLKKQLTVLYTDRTPREGRLERPDGITLEYAVVPLPDGASLISYVDITDQFRVEKALRERNEALEAADKLKSEFIANVSYGLRTPLNTIRGFAEILSNKYFGELNEKQSEYLNDILSASEELMSLINDILDLASIEAGYITLQYATFPVLPMLQRVVDSLKKRAEAKSLTITTQWADHLGMIEADEQRLRQAFFNILLNAIQYTPEKGQITVSAREEENMICLTVADTGIGIPADRMDKIFDKFEKGENQTRRSGIGLGLSLVKSFVDLHDGKIDLKSVEGQGTTLTLIIPKRPPNKALVEKVQREIEHPTGLQSSAAP